MHENERDDGFTGVLLAVILILVILGAAGGLYGMLQVQHARREAEHARMEAVAAEEAIRQAAQETIRQMEQQAVDRQAK